MVELMPRTETGLGHLQVKPFLEVFKVTQYFQSVLFDSLSCLAYHSVETKGIILSMGGTNQLLKTISELAKTGNADKKLITATKLLKVLSVDDQNKSEIFDSYGIG